MSLHEQIKARRKQLGLLQKDLALRTGIGRQQYQRLESRGNPSLKTLQLVAAGLELKLMLIPKEKARAVQALLAEDNTANSGAVSPDNPWGDWLTERGDE